MHSLRKADAAQSGTRLSMAAYYMYLCLFGRKGYRLQPECVGSETTMHAGLLLDLIAEIYVHLQ